MIKLNVEQGSDAWLQARLGICTASELKALVTPTGKISTGEGVTTYLCKKLAERWFNQPLQSYKGGEMEQGTLLEPEVLASIELALHIDLERIGFVTTDDGSFGASPDAMGYEIKSPQPPNHIRWLMANECPDEYLLQVQGCMYATGYDSWDFVSYRRGLPMLRVTVKRDPELMETIADALSKFNARMESGWKRLCELNGGEPKRPTPRTKPVDDTTMIGLETPEQLAAVGGPNFRSDT